VLHDEEAGMKLPHTAIIAAAAFALAAPALAGAQAPVTSFDQLNTRLKPGDTIWITDAQGREVKGRIRTLAPDAITLKEDGAMSFAARDVRLIREREHDSLKNGTLIGLGVGGGLAMAWCIGAAAESEDVDVGVECAEGFVVYAGLGTLVGLGIDAARPGKLRLVYRAAGEAGDPRQARLFIAPVMMPHTKGVAVGVRF
jgi:hypothetical protein